MEQPEFNGPARSGGLLRPNGIVNEGQFMAKRSDRQRQNSPVSAILYAVAIIALAACIVGLVYYSRTQRKDEAKRLSELAREESLQQEETEPSATEAGSSAAVNDTSATESEANESISEENTKAAAAVSAGSTALLPLALPIPLTQLSLPVHPYQEEPVLRMRLHLNRHHLIPPQQKTKETRRRKTIGSRTTSWF